MTSFVKSTRVLFVAFAFVATAALPQVAGAFSVSSSASLVASNSTSVTTSGGSTTVTTNGTTNTTNSSGTNSVTSSSVVQSTCAISVNTNQVTLGQSVTFSWNGSAYSNVQIGGTTVNATSGNYDVAINTLGTNIFQIIAEDTNGSTCAAQIIITCNPIPVDCKLDVVKTVDKTSAKPGDELTYTITVKNTGTTNCTGSGVKIVDQIDPNLEYLSSTVTSNFTKGYQTNVTTYNVYEAAEHKLYFTGGDPLTPGESGTITWTGRVITPSTCGDYEVKNQARATAFELNNFSTWSSSNTVTTAIDYDCPTPGVASCDLLTATPNTIAIGGSSTLKWETTNATSVTLNGVSVDANDTKVVSPATDTTYIIVATGTNGQSDSCTVNVNVSSDPVPVCNSFTATPSTLGVGGGNVTLNWNVSNATSVTISPTVGSVNLVDSTVVNVTQSTTFVLTATDSSGDQVTCQAPVSVADPAVFSCPANVNFTVNDSSIRRGQEVTLNWNVTGADSVSISSIGAVSSNDSRTVSPRVDTTYTLTATKGSQTINCPIRVNVSGGGGGGGSSSPRCDLDISETKITRGESVVLEWDTSRADDITITDDRGRIIVETEEDDGRVRVVPTRDTKYTLVAERGSRDRECEVEVEVEDRQVLGQIRDQQPLVAGIALSQVPYTGFEAGPVLTLMFYLLLMAWALYIAYFLVVRRENGQTPATIMSGIGNINTMPGGATVAGAHSMSKAEEVRPDAFVTSATVATPTNLPTSDKTHGYESYFAGNTVSETQADEVVTELENRAHAQRALLSSDAIAYFMKTTEGAVDRNETLDKVIADAKAEYPLEDGWSVINKTRMESLCGTTTKVVASATESLPTGSGSLAEAIVTGNVVAAYELIGNRPMFALAEASADLDSVVRSRKGENSPISDMLLEETKNVSDEQLQDMIKALTGAIDGTYTDEASAVKMAIMKAVKVIA